MVTHVDVDVPQLWRDYRAEPTLDLRNTLVELYLPLVKYNAERNGDTWPVHVGLARGYAAVGDNQKALEHAKKALEQAPDDLNRKSLEGMVKTLSGGQSNIND